MVRADISCAVQNAASAAPMRFISVNISGIRDLDNTHAVDRENVFKEL
jgi:hypothetical protein